MVPLQRSLSFVSQSTIWPAGRFKTVWTTAAVWTASRGVGSGAYTFPLCWRPGSLWEAGLDSESWVQAPCPSLLPVPVLCSLFLRSRGPDASQRRHLGRLISGSGSEFRFKCDRTEGVRSRTHPCSRDYPCSLQHSSLGRPSMGRHTCMGRDPTSSPWEHKGRVRDEIIWPFTQFLCRLMMI